MFDESNLCHLEVRDPNPPEVIAEKFESKAQAVLDSISTHSSSTTVSAPISQQRTVESPIKLKPVTSSSSNLFTENKVRAEQKESDECKSLTEDRNKVSQNTTTTAKILPSVRPTRTKLKETVSLHFRFNLLNLVYVH